MLDLDAIIDNLFRLEFLSQYIPSVIQIGVSLFWIFVTRRSKNGYKISLSISLFLLLLSMGVLVFTFNSVAVVIGEYAFVFLGIGTVQMLISKDSDPSPS